MPALKIAAAFSSQSAGQTYAQSAQGLLLEATSDETARLPSSNEKKSTLIHALFAGLVDGALFSAASAFP